MVKTVPLSALEENAANVFEAIILIARRARQINMEQKQIIEEEIGLLDESEEYDDDEVDRSALDRQFVKFPKPTSIALQELLDGNLKPQYKEEDE